MEQIRLYRPSSGSEGQSFMEDFCGHCKREGFIHSGDANDRKCDILNRSLIHELDDPEYPQEWQYREAGPVCTAYEYHSWRDESTGDWTPPEENDPPDPDQLDLFEDSGATP